jgi:hypothetical protein
VFVQLRCFMHCGSLTIRRSYYGLIKFVSTRAIWTRDHIRFPVKMTIATLSIVSCLYDRLIGSIHYKTSM